VPPPPLPPPDQLPGRAGLEKDALAPTLCAEATVLTACAAIFHRNRSARRPPTEATLNGRFLRAASQQVFFGRPNRQTDTANKCSQCCLQFTDESLRVRIN